MGFFDLPAPLLSSLDSLLSLFASASLRVVLWAALASAASMATYKALSNQKRLGAIKARIRETRTLIADNPPDDYAEALKLSRGLLSLSLRHVGLTLVPALAAGIPVLFVLAFLAANYSYRQPAPGEPVDLAIHYEDGRVAARTAHWPLREDKPPELAGVVNSPARSVAAPVIEEYGFLNMLFGNPAGYIEADSDVSEIELTLEPVRLIPAAPDWLAGWEAMFLSAMVVFSLAIKFAFRIH